MRALIAMAAFILLIAAITPEIKTEAVTYQATLGVRLLFAWVGIALAAWSNKL